MFANPLTLALLAGFAVVAILFLSRRKQANTLSTATTPQPEETPVITEITSQKQFDEVIKSGQPALIKFSAEWCPACKSQAPVAKEVAKQYKGKVAFYNVDFDKFKALSRSNNVRALPTLMFVKAGTRQSHVGFADSDELKAFIEAGLKATPETK